MDKLIGGCSEMRPPSTAQNGLDWLLDRARLVGQHSGGWAEAMIKNRGVEGVRVLHGFLHLAAKHTPATLKPQASWLPRTALYTANPDFYAIFFSMKQWIWLGAGVVAVAAIVGCKATRAGYESLDYTVLKKDGKFEVRRYANYRMVSTSMEISNHTENEEFKRLFHYIQGNNQEREKISMTTPVLITSEDTSPKMSFVVPKDVVSKGTPLPMDTNVSLQEVQAGRFAVMRFSGSRSGDAPKKAGLRLREWMERENLKEASQSFFAYYDPPWTPSFLRRNEVLVRISE